MRDEMKALFGEARAEARMLMSDIDDALIQQATPDGGNGYDDMRRRAHHILRLADEMRAAEKRLGTRDLEVRSHRPTPRPYQGEALW